METGPGSDLAKRLQGSDHPDDDGTADAALAGALADHATAPDDPARQVAVLSALAAARVLVPVVAVLGEVEVDAAGLTHDKSSDMAVVLLQSSEGRPGLLAFTSTTSLAAWDPAARPVPVTARLAALAALQEGAAAMLVDIAGETPFVVQAEDLDGIAAGWTAAMLGADRVWIGPAPE